VITWILCKISKSTNVPIQAYQTIETTAPSFFLMPKTMVMFPNANPIATNNGPSEVGMQKWTNGKQNHSYLADNRIDPGFDQAGNLFMDAWDGLSSLG
jgi:hypothetical protein